MVNFHATSAILFGETVGEVETNRVRLKKEAITHDSSIRPRGMSIINYLLLHLIVYFLVDFLSRIVALKRENVLLGLLGFRNEGLYNLSKILEGEATTLSRVCYYHVLPCKITCVQVYIRPKWGHCSAINNSSTTLAQFRFSSS